MALRLARHGLEVRGDPRWREIMDNAGGSVGYYDDLAGFYRTTAINLNSTSLQMKSAVNQRVFDCPAAGGFLIADAQPDLQELFDPETELVTYASLDELEEKTTYFLRRPDARLPIIQRAQRRILAHHTHRRRLEDLEAFLRSRYAE
jgi:spore maturation protein CgeB